MAKSKSKKDVVATDPKKLQEKKDAFVRVVTPRMDKAIKAIQLVGMCAGATYISTETQRRAVILALRTEVDRVEALFAGEGSTTTGFVLPE